MAEQEKMTKANAPPTPVFAIRLQDEVSKRTVVVNFSESTRVKQPETSESDIPIVVQVCECILSHILTTPPKAGAARGWNGGGWGVSHFWIR